ncbi:hemerythrin domain-containing protein [Clostridium sp. Marseille-P2415]|uniref:hemerythrin domain-containing protein n=1 Tax=Clostridium sp. Marseille-P2415 TaxID=1805471 RepID=UPI000988819A|nr:hemerythrin domain-containing protein [Clostridium sp. Marseille-P2415]
MYGIDILMKEHENILSFTGLLRSICSGILEGKPVETSLLRECVDFARNYADKHHHGKEEKVLFRIMLENMGPVAEKLIRNGMLVEHDLGRLYVSELEKAIEEYEKNPGTEPKLDIISNAVGYGALLKRHIEKEDEVAYTFAARALSEDQLKAVDDETESFEKQAEDEGVQDKYESWIRQKIK